jgi:hypothetical protein
MFAVSVAGQDELSATGSDQSKIWCLVSYVEGHARTSEMHELSRAGVYPCQKPVAIPLWVGLAAVIAS